MRKFKHRIYRALLHERPASILRLVELGLPGTYRVEQLIQFPLAAHDDGPDALAGAVQVKLKDFLYVAVFLAHNPPKGIHDMADDVHNGLSAFYEYIQRQKPMYFIHGHVHKNQESQVGETKVISVYGCRFLELPDK